MKQYLALTLLAASLGANAQSNVTIYGAADATFEGVRASGQIDGANRGTFSRLNSNGSYLGFKGSEDLGNGLKALFQFETAINLDTNDGFQGSRDSFVGLSSRQYGTIVAGNLTGPTRAAGLLADMHVGNAGAGVNSAVIGKATGGQGAGAFDTRFGNTVAYVSPTFNGFTFTGAYVSGENKSNKGVVPADVINTSGYDVGVTFAEGPVTVALTHGEVKNRLDSAAPGVNLDEAKITRLVGVYGFTGGHKVSALYEQTKNSYVGLGGDADLKRAAWGLAGKYQVSQTGAVIAQYYQANNPSGSFYADNSDRKARLYEIGYEHALSKRTVLKTAYTVLNNQASGDYDFANGTVGGATATGVDYKVVSAGIRHSF